MACSACSKRVYPRLCSIKGLSWLCRKGFYDDQATFQTSTMSSPLERALLRLQVFSKGPSLRHLLKKYLATQDVLNLRLTSHSLLGLAELNEVAFETIQIHTPVPHGRRQYMATLEVIGSLCRRVVVRVVYPPKPCCSTGTPSLSTNASTPRSSSKSDTISNILDSYCPYV